MSAAARFLLSALVAVLTLGLPATAHAQLAGAVLVESDYRLRGRSVSDERPVAQARLSYDDDSGFYTDGSATLVTTHDDGPRFLGYQFDLGYATRLGSLWTLDVGYAHDHLRSPYPGGLGYHQDQAYVGATRGPFSAYLFASPRYGRLKTAIVYGQLEATFIPVAKWHATAHAGALDLLDSSAPFTRIYDWRLGIAREIGGLEIHAALSGDVPGGEAHRFGIRAKSVLTAGASFSF